MRERVALIGRTPIDMYLQDIHSRHAAIADGAVATYIPELAKADPHHFGICLTAADGRAYVVGDVDVPFTIQSISKAFVFGLALMDHGRDAVMARVGVEPSGEAFNSIVFDQRANRPFNPMVNAGAIATAAMIKGNGLEERLGRVITFLEGFAGRSLSFDRAVFQSERQTGHRNRAIAHLELNSGMIDDRVDEHLDLYFSQCSVLVTARDLGLMAATLANGGVNPVTGRRAIDAAHVRHVVAVMSTCGMYDYAGEWLYRVGLPAKSGVGGGIIAVLPGQLGIGTFSPPLDERGNSVRGIKVCEDLSARLGLHMFDAPSPARAVLARTYRGDQTASKRLRPAPEVEALARAGRRIAILEIQGELNLAGAERVARAVADEVADSVADEVAHSAADESDGDDIRVVVIDCRRLAGVDPAAAGVLAVLGRQMHETGRELVACGLMASDRVAVGLRAAGWPAGDLFADLDGALEWAEDTVLGSVASIGGAGSVALAAMDGLQDLSPEQLARLEDMAVPVVHGAGARVFGQGDPPDRLYFLARGQVSIQAELDDGRLHRLGTVGPGNCFGEMALLDGRPRSAMVRADSEILCHGIDIAALRAQPDLLSVLLTGLARVLAERLRRANQEIRALRQ